MVPPVAMIASQAAFLAAHHCSIGLPRCPATTVKYSDAPVGYTCEMWHITSAGVPDSANDGRERFGDGGLQRGKVRPVGGGLEGLAERAGGQQGVAQVRGGEPATLPGLRGCLAQRRAAVGFQQRARLGLPALGVFLGALEQGQPQAAAGDLVFADRFGGGEVDPGLGLVGEPHDGGTGADLGDRAQRRGPGGEIGERPRLVPGHLRRRVHPQAHLGDDAEDALRADRQLAQVRAGRRRRDPPQIQRARPG